MLRTCSWVIALIAIVTCSPLTAQAAETMKVVAKESTWELRQGKDTFTDKSSCLMTVATKPYIQITSDSFAVGYRGRGGVKGYNIRVDDEPAGGMQLPSNIESQTGSLIFEGEAFNRIMKAKRIRIQVLTVTMNSITDDIDMKGADRLYARLSEFCPESRRSTR